MSKITDLPKPPDFDTWFKNLGITYRPIGKGGDLAGLMIMLEAMYDLILDMKYGAGEWK